MKIKPGFITLTGAAIFLITEGFTTLRPSPHMYQENLAGLKTVCPMAPMSSITIFVLGFFAVAGALLFLCKWKGEKK